MKKFTSLLSLLLGLSVVFGACVVTGQARVRSGMVVAYEEPPAPQTETYDNRPGYVWIKGHWEWNGNQWVWAQGYWENERQGLVWQEGRWERRGNAWHWIDGEWTNGASYPQPQPQPQPQPGVIVHDHRQPEPQPQPNVIVHDHRQPAAPNPMYPTQAPPPVRAEVPAQQTGYVWIAGRWDWQNAQWQWVPGHYERTRAAMNWTDGRWELGSQGYFIWIEGRWQ
jgi:WXXGXW repeat (2 copies)